METKITNIILDKDRFRVFAIINGNEEINTFLPDCTSVDIINWVNKRIDYYNDLKVRESELQEQLINNTLWQ